MDVGVCNSTKHYAGKIGGDSICAGFTDTDKSPCYVSSMVFQNGLCLFGTYSLYVNFNKNVFLFIYFLFFPQNDEGSPLMCSNENSVWELQGVLSYHSNCGRGHHPSVFSSISNVRFWIERTVGSYFERKTIFNVRRWSTVCVQMTCELWMSIVVRIELMSIFVREKTKIIFVFGCSHQWIPEAKSTLCLMVTSVNAQSSFMCT